MLGEKMDPQFGSQQAYATSRASAFGPPVQSSFNGLGLATSEISPPNIKHQNGPRGPLHSEFQQKTPMPQGIGPNQLSQQMGSMRISQPRPMQAQWSSTGIANQQQHPSHPSFGALQHQMGATPRMEPPFPSHGPHPMQTSASHLHASGPQTHTSAPQMPQMHLQTSGSQMQPPGPPTYTSGPQMHQMQTPGPPMHTSGPQMQKMQTQPPGPPTYTSGPQMHQMVPPGPQMHQMQTSGPQMQPGSGYPRPPQQASQTNGPSQHPPGMQTRYPANQQFNQMQAPAAQMQPQQGRRLDPDQMPSPIQVIEDDRKQRTGPFFTNTRGQVPPLVTTDFVVNDEGISSPRFIRSTIYSVPCVPEMLKQTSVPFAVSVCPLACIAPGETEPPVSNLGDVGPVRCIRCKAYMCAFMQFIDGGRRFQCVFCKATTEVPPEYFAHLDQTGQRTDKFQRPELCLGSYEFVATKEYCRKETFPNPPAFIFAIEVSFNSISNGVLRLLCNNMKNLLASLPRENGSPKSAVRVGFITYNSVVHFFNIRGNLAQPQMLVVSDVQDMFVPLLDGFLVTPDEAEDVLDSLLEQIPLMFSECRETEVVLGPVIQAGLEALKAADCAGKLFVFHASLPTCEAPGKLGNRDDRKLLGTDKEKSILSPQNSFYNTLGQECVTAACCVDLFLFPNGYVDIATLGQVSRLTGGDIFKYSFFKAQVDGAQFLADLQRDVQKPIAFDAIMRVRTSAGIRPTDFYGNYFMSNTTDVELAAVDCDKSLCVEIGYDDKLAKEDGVFVQVALLYTGCSGQRRLRVHNLALETCTAMADLYRSCELDAILNYFAKQGIRMLLEKTPKCVKENYVNRSAQILASYRKHCASPTSSGQLILPECMKLMPLYINCLIKSDALAGGPDLSTDDRSFAMSSVNSMDVVDTAGYFYPRLLALHDVDPEAKDLPPSVRCSVEKLTGDGVFLLENGIYLFLWVGQAVDRTWLRDVFAVQSPVEIDVDKLNLIELSTPLSLRVRDIVERVRRERKRRMRMVVVRQGDKLEIVFRQFLVEDKGSDGSTSYVDFLCHLHKEIRNLL